MMEAQLPGRCELFTQARRTSERRERGLGLGPELARAHGGELVAHGEGAGRGACFERVPVDDGAACGTSASAAYVGLRSRAGRQPSSSRQPSRSPARNGTSSWPPAASVSGTVTASRSRVTVPVLRGRP